MGLPFRIKQVQANAQGNSPLTSQPFPEMLSGILRTTV